MHFGVKKQKWGIRRYQNPDGSLTPLGRIHYGVGEERKDVKKESGRYDFGTSGKGRKAGEKTHGNGNDLSNSRLSEGTRQYLRDRYKNMRDNSATRTTIAYTARELDRANTLAKDNSSIKDILRSKGTIPERIEKIIDVSGDTELQEINSYHTRALQNISQYYDDSINALNSKYDLPASKKSSEYKSALKKLQGIKAPDTSGSPKQVLDTVDASDAAFREAVDLLYNPLYDKSLNKHTVNLASAGDDLTRDLVKGNWKLRLKQKLSGNKGLSYDEVQRTTNDKTLKELHDELTRIEAIKTGAHSRYMNEFNKIIAANNKVTAVLTKKPTSGKYKNYSYQTLYHARNCAKMYEHGDLNMPELVSLLAEETGGNKAKAERLIKDALAGRF